MTETQGTQLDLIRFEYEARPVRMVIVDGEVWFVALDICRELGINWRGRETLSGIKQEWIGVKTFHTSQGKRDIIIINEPAVYKLIFRSRKPEAEHFTDWIAEEVLPQIKETGSYKAQIPYHLHRYMANKGKIPYTHFSILNELSIRLIGPLESQGYTLPENMVPDISEGRMFSKWLRDEKGVDTNALPSYLHRYEDGRIVRARLYPIDLLPDFIRHFNNIWLPNRALYYFKDRDPNALPYLQKLLTSGD